MDKKFSQQDGLLKIDGLYSALIENFTKVLKSEIKKQLDE